MVVFRDFISFLKKPDLGKKFEIKSPIPFLKLVWKSFLIIFAIYIVVFLVISTPLDFFHLLPAKKIIIINLRSSIIAILIAPIIEELIFRLPLRFSKVNIITSFCLVIFLILNKLNFYLALSISIVLLGFLLLRINEGSDIIKRADNFFTRYFFWIFYFQVFLFGFLHLINFNLDFRYFYLFPFFIIGYILIGCYLGYIRVRYNLGIYICIVTHMVINGVYCLINFR